MIERTATAISDMPSSVPGTGLEMAMRRLTDLNDGVREPGILAEKPSELLTQSEDVLAELAVPSTVLIVEDNDVSRRLLRGMLKAADYRILEAKRASEGLAILGAEKIDLVILDLVMPEVSGPEFCRRMKAQSRTQLVPILMMTSVQGVENEIAGISSGADEFLLKPLHPTVLRTRVRAMLRNKALIDSLEEAETILFAMAQSVEHRDRYTGHHCQRLASYGVLLGKAAGVSRTQLLALFRGGYLHDIGKIAIPDSILFKNGKLTEDEWYVMRMHTIKGEEICRPMKSLAPVLPIIRSHHERWDGSGYPDGLDGERIPLLARILQVVDIYDALITARPYKPAYTHKQAVEILESEAARGWRDPKLVPLFSDISRRMSGEQPSVQDLTVMQQSLANMNMHLVK